jgi:threonine dehydratase
MVINVSDLDPARIAAAATVIDPVFLHSPQYLDVPLSHHLGRRIVVKDETRNPLRSFKGRGADYLASEIAPGRHLVCASSGNFGQAVAYASRSRGHRCSVFLATGSNPIAQERIRGLGAEVRLIAGDDTAVMQQARHHASAAPDRILVRDGHDVAIAEGAGTIGLELLAAGALDAVVVPVGDGALISGIGCVVKQHAPRTRVIGVCPASAPSMAASWQRGVPTRAPAHTIASGLSIVDPVPSSIRRMQAFVDEMVLVTESGLIDAMRLAADHLGALLEPSGAATIAALLEHDLPGDRIAIVLTGSMLRPEHLALVVDTATPTSRRPVTR